MDWVLPKDCDREAVLLFMRRSGAKFLWVRLGTGVVIAGIALAATRLAYWPAAAAWLALALGADLFSAWYGLRLRRQLKGEPSRRTVALVAFKLSVMCGAIMTIYTLPAVVLACQPYPGPPAAVTLCVVALMNIAAHHVLHVNMALYTLPWPALTMLFAAWRVGGDRYGVFLAGCCALLIVHALSLARSASRSYATLIDANARVKEEAAARAEADHANAAKSRFLAAISHELRTPLNAIIGYTEMVREAATVDRREDDVKDLGRVLRAARQLLQLINDVLDFSKAEAGAFPINPKPVLVGPLLQEALDAVRPQIAKGGNCLIPEFADDLGVASIDGFRLTQCVLNLLSNAAKFTHGGVVRVSARRRVGESGAELLEIRVSDTGIGMTPEQMQRLFRPFAQADASVAQRFGGTGLGLALSRRLAQLMGGDITVESKPEQGSTFTLTVLADLPLAAGANQGEMQAGEHTYGAAFDADKSAA